MTIDEAIEDCKEIANYPEACKECVNDHIQLVYWLTELKQYKEISKENLDSNIELNAIALKIKQLEDDFWKEYSKAEAMPNILLDIAIKIMRLKGNIIRELERENKELKERLTEIYAINVE